MKDAAKHTQRDECYTSLRRMLVHNQLPAGQRLTETAWSDQFGVTRGALREAMSMLCHEGLLVRGEHGGFFTPVLQPRDYAEVMEVRFAMETGALRLVAIKDLPTKTLSKMRETFDVMERMIEEDFEMGFMEADRRFHELLVEAGQNARLIRIYSQAPLPLAASNEPDGGQRRENLKRTLREHRDICELMEKGNTSEACKVLEKHLFTSRSLAEKGIKRNVK